MEALPAHKSPIGLFLIEIQGKAQDACKYDPR